MLNSAVIEDTTNWKDSYNKVLIAPERRDLAKFFRSKRFVVIDRSLKVAVPLQKKEDFARFCRIPVEKCTNINERIFEIAESSFLLDSRFMDNADPTELEIKENISARVKEVKKCFICKVKGETAGFLELVKDEEQKQAEIALAAVDEKYRVAGVALSLYAGVAKICRDEGFSRLVGVISSRNVAVMNLYATLGAVFSSPYDIYVKLRTKCDG